MKNTIPAPNSNTHSLEVRTTQNRVRTRDSPDFGEPLSAHTSSAFLDLGHTAQEKKSLTFFLPFQTEQVPELVKHKCKIMKKQS